MRFHDVLTLLTFCGPAIALVNSLGVFSYNYYTAPETSTFTLSEMTSLAGQTGPLGIGDYVGMAVSSVLGGMGWLQDMIGTIVFVYPSMVDILHVPAPVAALSQCVVVLSIVTFLIQLASKFGWGQAK